MTYDTPPLDWENLKKREVEYHYPEDEDGDIYCEVRALGIVFCHYIEIGDAEDRTLECWLTEDASDINVKKISRN